MSGSGAAGAIWRSPLTLAVVGAVVGVVLALALGGLGLFGNPTANASPTSPSGSVGPSASLVAAASDAPSPGVSPAPVVTTGPISPPPPAPTTPPTPRPAKTPKPSPTANINPTIVEFNIPKVFDCTGDVGSTMVLSWKVINATGVTLSIDGGGVYNSYPGTSGSDPFVPFGCDANVRTHTYTLRTTGGSGGPADVVTREVKWGAQKIVSFRMGPGGVANCPNDASTTTVGITLKYEIKYATGVILERDGEIYANYAGKVVNTTGIAYQCSEGAQVFRLTTTGGYGQPDTMEITVTRQLP
jgi:hypothetical protein